MSSAITSTGKMRKRIVIESTSSASDNQGGRTGVAWATFLSSWAEVSPKTGQARLEAQNLGTENPTTVTMRYRPGVSPKMRVKLGTRILKIVSILNPEELNQWLVIECDEVTG